MVNVSWETPEEQQAAAATVADCPEGGAIPAEVKKLRYCQGHSTIKGLCFVWNFKDKSHYSTWSQHDLSWISSTCVTLQSHQKRLKYKSLWPRLLNYTSSYKEKHKTGQEQNGRNLGFTLSEHILNKNVIFICNHK